VITAVQNTRSSLESSAKSGDSGITSPRTEGDEPCGRFGPGELPLPAPPGAPEVRDGEPDNDHQEACHEDPPPLGDARLVGMVGTQIFWGTNPRAPIGG
jgi:hypothetical protein